MERVGHNYEKREANAFTDGMDQDEQFSEQA